MAIKKITLLLIFFFLYFTVIFAQKNSSKVLLEIEETQVTVDEFLYVFQKNRTTNRQNLKSEMLDYLDFFTKFKLKIYEAKKQKLDEKRSFKQELAAHEKQLKKSFLNKRHVSETMLLDCYEKSKFELNVAHILSNCKSNANPKDTLKAYNKLLALNDSLLKGIAFDTLAKKYSDDPSSKTNFGDIGYISTFNTVYPFERQAYLTEVGHVSEIVRTQFGYHLIKVLDKRKNLGKIEVAQLFLSCSKEAPQFIHQEKEKQIKSIYQSILSQKMSFEKAVAMYSQENFSKKNKGLINPFKRGEKEAIFELNAFNLNLNNPISKPFLTDKGWFILKLVEQHQLKSIEEERQNLKKKLLKDERSKLPEAQYIAHIKKENDFKLNTFYKNSLFKKLLKEGLRNNWKLKTYQNYQNPIIQIGNKEFSQFDFLKFLRLKKFNAGTNEKQFLENSLNKFINKSCLDYAAYNLSNNNKKFKYLLQEYKEGILLFNLTQKEIWDKSQNDSIGLLQFYAQNKHNYLWEERAKASIYKSKEEKDIKKLIKFLKKGKSEQKILKKVPSLNIEKGNFESGKNKYLDVIDWAEKTYPIQKWGDEYILIKIDEILKPASKKLNEAKGFIIADYQDELTKEWEEKLMKKYKVKVHKSVLENL